MSLLSKTHSRIQELEEELKTTKYNKRSQHHIGLIKAKLSILRENQIKSSGQKSPPTVKKSGDATVLLVGFPSVGKSTLLNAITNANSKVAHYAFTTLDCIPGLLEYKHAKIQILDVPGIVAGASEGKGRGKSSLSYAMASDMALIIIEVFHPEHLEIILNELNNYNLRINQKKPDVKIEKKSYGGLDIGTTVRLTKIDRQTIVDILKEFRILNGNVVIREDITPEQLIDVIEGNKKYIPAIIVVNKIDMAGSDDIKKVNEIFKPDIFISAENKTNLEELKRFIFTRLALIRIYCKEIGKKADLDVPLIMTQEATLREVCLKLHRDFADKFRFARIWGKSVKYQGMPVRRLEFKLSDGDVVELHIR
ncbi:MAG: GTP-binding protein [Nanoarchaeota archaeon]